MISLISCLFSASKEKTEKELKAKIEAETKVKEQALEDAQGIEVAFSEVHKRYEKMKQVLEGFKKVCVLFTP